MAFHQRRYGRSSAVLGGSIPACSFARRSPSRGPGDAQNASRVPVFGPGSGLTFPSLSLRKQLTPGAECAAIPAERFQRRYEHAAPHLRMERFACHIRPRAPFRQVERMPSSITREHAQVDRLAALLALGVSSVPNRVVPTRRDGYARPGPRDPRAPIAGVGLPWHDRVQMRTWLFLSARLQSVRARSGNGGHDERVRGGRGA